MKAKKVVQSVSLILALVSLQAVGFAGSKGRRNTAAVLTGATLYEAIKGDTKTAVVFGVGSAVAWKQYEIARDREKRQARARAASSRANYRGSYRGSAANYSRSVPRYVYRSSSSGASAAASRSTIAALKTHLAATQAKAAVRQEAMQRNLNELAAQTKVLGQQNAQMSDQLVAMRVANANAMKANRAYLNWALLATLLGVAAVGGLTYAYFKHPWKPAHPQVLQALH